MVYREAAMLEVKEEVLRLWPGGVRNKRIVSRRYLRATQAHAVMIAASPDELEQQPAAHGCQHRSAGHGAPP
jgi:hypothetical protein